MRRFSAVALLVVILGASSAQASTWLGDGGFFSRSKIVKLLKKFITIVQDGDGDGMSVPKP
jgi:hypothetical protein